MMAEFHLKFHHSIQKYFCSKASKQGDFGHYLIDFKDLSGFESLSGLFDLKRHDNITGLNDLNSLFGLKKSKAACWVNSMPSGTSAASMTSTASTTSVASMTSTASFHIKNH